MCKYNGEGYYDPTAYEAIKKVEREQRKWKPLVYICSPYADDVEVNTQKARLFCRYAVDTGAIPIATHLLLPQFMSEEKERDLALFMGIVLMCKCDEVWVFGNTISPGMSAELDKAKRKKMKIRHFTDDCIEVMEE